MSGALRVLYDCLRTVRIRARSIDRREWKVYTDLSGVQGADVTSAPKERVLGDLGETVHNQLP